MAPSFPRVTRRHGVVGVNRAVAEQTARRDPDPLFRPQPVVGPGIAFFLLRHFVNLQKSTLDLLDVEREKSESLLLNVLPEQVSGRLKDGQGVIADYHPAVSILFADVVGFTVMSSGSGPEKMIGVLNEIFSYFDELAVKYGVEKIRTIGDGYMAVCGAPVERDDHASRIANMALEMLAYDMPEVDGQRCQMRIGLNSGDVIAGVVGTTKFHYDVWGDAVNVAARMESQGASLSLRGLC